MVACGPRIDPRLRRLTRRLSRRGSLPIAEIHRSVGAYATRLALVRPSYEQTRILVNDARLQHLARRAAAELVRDVYFGVRPVRDLYPLLKE